MKFGISDFKAKSGRDSGLKVYAGDEMPKITVGITGSMASWVGITRTNWGPTNFAFEIIVNAVEHR